MVRQFIISYYHKYLGSQHSEVNRRKPTPLYYHFGTCHTLNLQLRIIVLKLAKCFGQNFRFVNPVTFPPDRADIKSSSEGKNSKVCNYITICFCITNKIVLFKAVLTISYVTIIKFINVQLIQAHLYMNCRKV